MDKFTRGHVGLYVSATWASAYNVVRLALNNGWSTDPADIQDVSDYYMSNGMRNADTASDVADEAVDWLGLHTSDDVAFQWEDGELNLSPLEQVYAEEWDVEPEAVKAFSEHHGGWDFTQEQFTDSYSGETEYTDEREWYFNDYLPDADERFEEFLETARSMSIMIEWQDVDGIAVKQDVTIVTSENRNFVFHNNY